MDIAAQDIRSDLGEYEPIMATSTPLCVDMDGTLINTDAVIECLSEIIRKRPFLLAVMPFWLLKGIPYFKWQLAKKAKINCANLPYNRKLLTFLNGQRALGRTLVLATGANRIIADGVAHHLGIFSAVYSSTPTVNLTGSAKAATLTSAYGRGGFDYIGDSQKDLTVWDVASKAIVVNGTKRLAKRVIKEKADHRIVSIRQPAVKSMIRVLRPHQWAKNVLVFFPMLLANQFGWEVFIHAIIAFVAFSLIASSGYVFNDLLDIASDRRHEEKSKRPFASGDLSVIAGMALIPTLFIGAIATALVLGFGFVALIIAYFILTTAYSIKLKRVEIVDVILLSGFYSLRIHAGALATGIVTSIWLLAFSTFFFLNLAFIKRSAELVKKISQGDSNPMGRAYQLADQPQLSVLGSVSGFVSILVLALYINSDVVRNLYKAPEYLWVICLVLMYWVSRIWLLTNRGFMSHDPVLFALRDKGSWLGGLIVAVAWALARGLIH